MDLQSVGIDLGTTHSVVACVDSAGRPTTLPNSEGDLTTPSVVFFDDCETIVGKEAMKLVEFEARNIARFAKRELGKAEFEQAIRGRNLPPEVIEAVILRRLKADAEMRLGQVAKAVITVPAYFNEPRRKATEDAGRLAGLDVLDIINEPTAAAIAYGVQQDFFNAAGTRHGRETVLVYDLGGGTFDVTLMAIEGRQFQALGTAGDVYLGGVDWDVRLLNHVVEECCEKFGFNPRDDDAVMQRLQVDVEDAKRSLTARESTSVQVSFGGKRHRIDLTREVFEELTADLLDRTLFTVRRVLRDAGKQWPDVTRLLLVGGSTRMPMVPRMLEAESGLSVDRSLSPDECVAHGAAIYASFLSGDSSQSELGDLTIENVCSHDLGVLGVERGTGMKRRRIMIPRNSALPAVATKKFSTLRANQRSVAVEVVEGGDASGQDATRIGRCSVTDLPEDLPANTLVEVVFKYANNGRLTVHAWLPTVNRKAELTIERAAGLSPEEMRFWRNAIATDFPADIWQAEVAGSPKPPAPPPVPVERQIDDGTGRESSAPETSGEKTRSDLSDGSQAPKTGTTDTRSGGWRSRRVRVVAGDEENAE